MKLRELLQELRSQLLDDADAVFHAGRIPEAIALRLTASRGASARCSVRHVSSYARPR